MQTLDLHLCRIDLDRTLANGRRKDTIAIEIGIARTTRNGTLGRKRQLTHTQVILRQLLGNHLIISRIDERATRMLVLCDTHFRVDIVLETVVVAIQMVGCNVHQHRHIGTEIVHTIELERAEFQHIPIVFTRSDRVGKTLADIATERHVVTRIAQNLIGERGGCCLTVRACDTDSSRLALVATCKLDLRDDGCSLRTQSLHHGGLFGDSGALDDLVGRQNTLHRMATLLVLDTPFVEGCLVAIGNATRVRKQGCEAEFLCQNCRAVTADTATQHYYLLLFHRFIGF